MIKFLGFLGVKKSNKKKVSVCVCVSIKEEIFSFVKSKYQTLLYHLDSVY